jgi:hypothetical protein
MKRSLIALALAAALPMSAQAAGPDYSYAELNYNTISQTILCNGCSVYDGAEGFGLRGSFEFNDDWYVFGAYNDGGSDLASQFSYDSWQLGLGYHTPINDNADWMFELSYNGTQNEILEALTGDDSDNGWRLSAGANGSVSERVNLFGKLNFARGGRDYTVTDQGFSATAGMRLQLTEMWGLVGEVEAGDGYTVSTFGVRANF